LQLRLLRHDDEAAFAAAWQQARTHDRNFAHYYEEGRDFREYSDYLRKAERGEELPEGHVPNSCLFAFLGSEIVGRLSLRYQLTDFLLQVGGHIGYVVLPEHRRKGYATEMLFLSLPLARNLGLPRVLLTCDENNEASRRTIEKCGGVFENRFESPDLPEAKLRYWITL
jgi:predicted acetyltransferase